jgi:hypothetical protein
MPSVVALFSTYPESYLCENAFCIMKKAYFCSRNKVYNCTWQYLLLSYHNRNCTTRLNWELDCKLRSDSINHKLCSSNWHEYGLGKLFSFSLSVQLRQHTIFSCSRILLKKANGCMKIVECQYVIEAWSSLTFCIGIKVVKQSCLLPYNELHYGYGILTFDIKLSQLAPKSILVQVPSEGSCN